jgi:NAD(P)-dependent dehydrogenase (short-subunit alcohol dehydrogenase family)
VFDLGPHRAGSVVNARLKGKTALITGGASGIGLGISRALAAEGVNLAIAGLSPDPEQIDNLRRMNVRAVGLDVDVSREDQVIRMVSDAIDVFGHVDLYINNAAWAWHRPITRLDAASWTRTIDTNLSACAWACREVARHMVERQRGSILIIGSTAMATPLYGEVAYRVSKTGLVAMMEVLAIELAPFGIRVNMIVPGHFATRLTAAFTGEPLEILKRQIPLRRTGDPDEVGPAAVFLLSDHLSPYTTGAYLMVDGGLHLHPLPIFGDNEIIAMNAPSQEPTCADDGTEA